MVVRCDVAIPNMVARIVNQCVLFAGVVAHVPIAEVRDVGADEVQLEEMLVRQAFSDMGNRLADLQEMPQAKDSGRL